MKRNVLVMFLFSCALLLPCGSVICRLLEVPLPDWAMNVEVRYLQGGGSVRLNEHLNWEGAHTGELQNAVDEVISSVVPAKAQLLLGDAALERGFIRLSNGIFQWPCYPTRYGASQLYCTQSDTVRYMPKKRDAASVEGLEAFGRGVAEYAAEHPDIRISLVLPVISVDSPSNPAYPLVSDVINMSEYIETLESQVKDIENIRLVAKDILDYEDYLEEYYSTDDHWCGYGAIDAFNMMMTAWGRPESGLWEIESDETVDRYIFNGQNARLGLMLVDRGVREPLLETSTLKLLEGAGGGLVQGEPPSPQDLKMIFSFYASWYGVDEDTTIGNGSYDESERILLISDSYGDAFRWILAQRYGLTYDKKDLYYAARDTSTLSERLQQTQTDEVVFAGSIWDYAEFMERQPAYFE